MFNFSWFISFESVLKVNFLSQVIFVFLLFWGMVMYANDIETNGKQKLPEIKKLISSLDFFVRFLVLLNY